MKTKSFSIRMEEAMLNEIRKIAKRERRSVNKQIIFLVRSYMEKYEEKRLPCVKEAGICEANDGGIA